MNKYLSDKLKAISFMAIIMVVYLHAYHRIIKPGSDSEALAEGYNSFIQYFISHGITRIAVPVFFIISGYLFFLNIKNGKISMFLSKFQKRVKTLFLPYLLWSAYGLLFYFLLQSVPAFSSFFTNELIKDYSTSDFFNAILINPIPYQLWFIRDLVIMVILSPLIYWLIKYFNYSIILILVIPWVINFNFVLFANEALLFFVAGAYLGIKGINLQNKGLQNQYLFFTVSWLLFLFCKTILAYTGYENTWLVIFLHKASILLGVLAIWYLYDHLFKNEDVSTKKYYTLFQFTFFLFVFHEPVLTVFKKRAVFFIREK